MLFADYFVLQEPWPSRVSMAVTVLFLSLAAAIFTLPKAHAQSSHSFDDHENGIMPDTLDWRRYFPLEVGNVWEYEVTEGGPPLWRREVVGDTVKGAWRYFVLDELNPRKPGRTTYYARYDSAAFVVIVSDLAEDTIPAPRWGCCHGVQMVFDLGAAFGDTLRYTFTQTEDTTYIVKGGYGGEVLDRPVEAIKCFDTGWWRECYAAGVGVFRGESLQRIILTYAFINGTEYGTSRYTSIEPPGQPTKENFDATIFPNPATSFASIVLGTEYAEMVKIAVINMLGQEVWSDSFISMAGTKLDLNGFPSGPYYLKFSTDSGRIAFRPLFVIR